MITCTRHCLLRLTRQSSASSICYSYCYCYLFFIYIDTAGPWPDLPNTNHSCLSTVFFTGANADAVQDTSGSSLALPPLMDTPSFPASMEEGSSLNKDAMREIPQLVPSPPVTPLTRASPGMSDASGSVSPHHMGIVLGGTSSQTVSPSAHLSASSLAQLPPLDHGSEHMYNGFQRGHMNSPPLSLMVGPPTSNSSTFKQEVMWSKPNA